MVRAKHLAMFMWLWSYGVLQTFIGFLVLIFHIRKKHFWYKGTVVTVVPNSSRNRSLGAFIFVGKELMEVAPYKTISHEYGHSIQSCILGPIWWFIIALPSKIWTALIHPKVPRPYGWFYTESWANSLSDSFRRR